MPEPSRRIRLVVLFGGRSAEHDVSCVSAASVLGAVDPDRYDVVAIGIDRDGRWVLADEAMSALERGVASLPRALTVAGEEVDPLPAVLPPPASAAGTDTVVFPILHGPMGEDGTVQGMLELAGVPYVGSGVLASALGMDKAMAKEVLARAGIPQVAWLSRRDGQVEEGFAAIVGRDLGYPAFVKPANMGSSVGVTKAADPESLAAALETAFAYDEWAVVEQAVVARELECAVLGNLDPEATVLGEIIPSREFYDYDDKYSGSGADLQVPADVSDAVMEEGRRLAKEAFVALRCEGLARVDFFYLEDEGRLLVNEVNTIPGFTPFSMYPQLWEASGLSYSQLIDRLVDLALERHRRRAPRLGRDRPR